MQEITLLNKDDFYRKLEGLLNLPSESLKGDQSLQALKNWDSLAILEFLVLADNEYQSDVQPQDIANCQTLDDLAQLTLAQSSKES